MRYIIMSAYQANKVRGQYLRGCLLLPLKLTNGKYALPENVIDDPDYAEISNYLKTLELVNEIEVLDGNI